MTIEIQRQTDKNINYKGECNRQGQIGTYVLWWSEAHGSSLEYKKVGGC